MKSTAGDAEGRDRYTGDDLPCSRIKLVHVGLEMYNLKTSSLGKS